SADSLRALRGTAGSCRGTPPRRRRRNFPPAGDCGARGSGGRRSSVFLSRGSVNPVRRPRRVSSRNAPAPARSTTIMNGDDGNSNTIDGPADQITLMIEAGRPLRSLPQGGGDRTRRPAGRAELLILRGAEPLRHANSTLEHREERTVRPDLDLA